MPDPVSYPRGGVSAQSLADETRRAAQMVQESKRRIVAADTQGADASSLYRQALVRESAAEREIAVVTDQAATKIEAAAGARRAAATAAEQSAEAMRIEAQATREATAALGEYEVVASRSGRTFSVARNGEAIGGSYRTADRAAAQAAALRAAEGANLALAGGGGGGMPPVVPPVAAGGSSMPPGGGGSGGAAQQINVDETLAANEQRLLQLRAQAGGQMAALSTDTRRYGALTSEFFEALGRGEVTVRELGYQVGVTAAKFGGWTLAAGAVFGLLAGINELRTGAVQAQSGVQTLQRFVPNLNQSTATQGLIDVSQQLVEPIQNVAEAQAAFARVTHDQEGSLTAARVAILASKLDNISLADSYRYLVGVMQELQVPASALPGIFDQISGAQRNLGARVQEVLPALAKSVGAVRTAGGDFHQLLAEMSLAIVTTGQTGNLVGTAFARGAANFYNSQATLRGVGRTPLDIQQSLGIDTSLGFTQRLQQALQVGSKLPRQQQLLLSEAFFGPQRGGLLAGIFRQGPQLDRFLQGTSPGFTAGSAMKEWQDQAGRADVQISRLKVSLQDIGAEAVKVGALQPFGWLLWLGNNGLNIIEHALRGFGDMPPQLRTATEAALTFLAVIKGLQSFAGGQMLARIPLLGAIFDNPAARAGKLLGTGLAEATSGAQMSAVREAQASTRAVNFAAIMQEEATQRQAQVAALRAAGAGEEEIAAAETEATAAAQAAAKSTAEAASAAARATAAQRAYAAATAEQAAVANMSAEEQMAYGAQKDLMIRSHFGAPTSDPLVLMREYGMTEQAALLQSISQGSVITERQVGLLTAARARLAVQLTKENSVLAADREAAGLETAEIEATVAAQTEFAATVPLTTAALNTLSSAGQFLVANLGRLTIGLFAGMLILDGIKQSLHEQQQADQSFSGGLHEVDQSWSAYYAHLKTMRDNVKSTRNRESQGALYGVPLLGDLAGALSTAPGLKTLAELTGTFDKSHHMGQQEQVQRAYAQVFQQMTDQAYHDGQTLTKTAPGREKWYTELRKLTSQARATVGRDPLGQQALQTFLNVLQQIYAGFQQQAPINRISRSDPFGQFSTQSLSNNVKNLQALGDQVKVLGPTQQRLQQMAYLYTYIASSVSSKTSDADLQKVAQALSYFSDAVTSDVQDKIDAAESITIPSKKAAGYAARAVALRKRSSLLQAAGAELHRDEHNLANAYGDLAKANQDAVKSLQDAVAALDNARQQMGVISTTINSAGGAVNRALAPFGLHINLQDPLRKYEQAATTARGAANDAHQRLAQAGAAKQAADTKLSQEANRIANDQQNYANQLASNSGSASQDAFERIRLRGELAKARDYFNPVAVAADDILAAQQEKAVAKTWRDRLQAEIDLANAENAYQSAVQDVMAARLDYLKSTTTDPVKQAADDVKSAAEAVSFDTSHGGTSTAKYWQDKAKLNDARQKYAEANITAREDTIEFRLKMNEISSQTAIQEYEALLHMHGITKQLRRQILERIQELKNAGQQDFAALDLGSIRLPTPYEIRRSIQAIRDQGAASAVYHNEMAIHVYNAQDAAAVGVQVDRFMGGTGKALARAAGTR